ncbi:hypothetical protein BMETH_685133714361666, partial [methanotrophic bacterial endosymbiont of Bathymodiolus sp.]
SVGGWSAMIQHYFATCKEIVFGITYTVIIRPG